MAVSGDGSCRAVSRTAAAKRRPRSSQQPERVAALVLISATTHFPKQARAIITGMTEETRTEDEWAMMRARHTHGDDQIRALWRVGREFANSDDDMAFTADGLASITAPTLIVHGDRDPFFPVDIATSMHKAIPTAWLWVVPNGGHLTIVGEGLTDRFVEAASAFLRGGWEAP